MWGVLIMHIEKKHIKWFTLMEVVLVCTVFAIMVVGIIGAINRAYTYMWNIKLQVRATNFAREWVEMMYNIRDTNWRRYSWLKDIHRLWIGTWNENFEAWLYALKEWRNGSWDTYFYASGVLNNTIICGDTSVDELYSSDRPECLNFKPWSDYAITFTWTYYYASWTRDENERTNVTWSVSELLTNDAEFYRVLRVYWIYDKDSNTNYAESTNLTDSSPKEMRFCVKVRYKWVDWHPHDVEICSIMTNFEE